MLQVVWRDVEAIHPIWHGRKSGQLQFDILRDPVNLAREIAQSDIVLNLAGATHHGAEPVANMNTLLAEKILDASQAKPVFLISSAAVYGPQKGRLSEDTQVMPISEYAEDKVEMEKIAKKHSNARILRLGNVLGADALLGVKRDHYLVDRFADGQSPRRSYIAPHQFGMIIAQLVNQFNSLPKLLNVATPRPVSMGALLDAANLNWEAQPAPKTAISEVALDTTRLEKHITFDANASDAEVLVNDWKIVSKSL